MAVQLLCDRDVIPRVELVPAAPLREQMLSILCLRLLAREIREASDGNSFAVG